MKEFHKDSMIRNVNNSKINFYDNHRKQRSLEETTHATCDVILRCGASGAVPVHSCILVAISRFFRRLLGGQAIRRVGQHGLAVGIAGGALDVVNRSIYLL